jgi:hypothetical protein
MVPPRLIRRRSRQKGFRPDFPLANGKGRGYKGNMLAPWATKPEMILTYVLFLLAALISVYSSAIRRFLAIIFTVPPKKIRSAWKASNLAWYRAKLLELNRRHNNGYELTLFVAMEVARMGISTAFVVVLSGLLALGLYQHPEMLDIQIIILFSLIPFFLVLPLGGIYIECRRLVNYDEYVKYLEEKIAELS